MSEVGVSGVGASGWVREGRASGVGASGWAAVAAWSVAVWSVAVWSVAAGLAAAAAMAASMIDSLRSRASYARLPPRTPNSRLVMTRYSTRNRLMANRMSPIVLTLLTRS